MTIKIYKPVPILFFLYNAILLVFAFLLLMMIYALSVTVIEALQQAVLLAFSTSQTLLSLVPFFLFSIVIILTIVAGIIFFLTANTAVHVSKHGFRVTVLIYKSDWLPWESVQKVRTFSFREGNQLAQIGIDRLNWMYKLNGLLFWMFPYGAILVGEKNMQDGHKLLRTFKQKRPDLFDS